MVRPGAGGRVGGVTRVAQGENAPKADFSSFLAFFPRKSWAIPVR